MPEPKAGKDRRRLDLHASVREQEVQRLRALGASEVERHRGGDFE